MIFGINSLIGRYFGYYLLFLNKKYDLKIKVIGTTRNIKKVNHIFQILLMNLIMN